MLIGMVKDSALLYIIGVAELLRVTNLLANRTFRYFEVYLALLLIYLTLTTLIYYGIKYLETRLTAVDYLTEIKPSRSFRQRRRTATLKKLQEAVLAEGAAPGLLSETPTGDQ